MDASTDFPRVTICVPVRNGSRTIRRTLDLILAQDYPNLEVIVSETKGQVSTINKALSKIETRPQYLSAYRFCSKKDRF